MGCTRDMTQKLNKLKTCLADATAAYRILNGNRRNLKVVDEQLIQAAVIGAKRAEDNLNLLVDRIERRRGQK